MKSAHVDSQPTKLCANVQHRSDRTWCLHHLLSEHFEEAALGQDKKEEQPEKSMTLPMTRTMVSVYVIL